MAVIRLGAHPSILSSAWLIALETLGSWGFTWEVAGGSGVRSCEPELLHVSWVLSPRRNGCLVLNKC